MSNILEFIIKFKDQMSSGITAIGANVDKTFSKMDLKGKQVNMTISGISKRLDELQKTRDLSLNLRDIKAANREMQSLEKQRDKLTGGGKGGGGLSVMGLAKGYIGAKALQYASEGIMGSVNSAMERGMNKTSFGVLTGSKAGGDKLTGDLSSLAADTILGPGVFKNAQTMLSFGVEAKNIMPIMKMLGDISGGSQDKLDGLALAFANTASAGKLTGQDLLQYVNAGFNPLNEISRTTGKSMSDMRKVMEDGGITVKMVADAMQTATGTGGRFNDMLNKAAETPYGKYQKLTGQIEELAIKFGDILMPVVSKLMDMAGPLVDIIGNGIEKFGAMINPISSKVKALVMTMQPAFKALMEIASPLFNHIKDFVSRVVNALLPVLSNIGNILVPIIRIVGPELGMILDILGWIIEKVGWALEKITWLFSKIADGVNWLLDKTIGVTKSKTDIIKDVIKAGVSDNQLADFFKKIGELHGANYTNSLFVQMRKVARWADNFYNTNFFSQKLEDVKAKMLGGKDAVVKSNGSSAYSFSAGAASSDAKKDKEKLAKDVNGITGGGTRNTYINLGKFQDSINIHVASAKEGVDQMQEMIENSLLRILNSAQ